MSLQQANEIKENKTNGHVQPEKSDCGKQHGPLLKGQGVVLLAWTRSGVCQSFFGTPNKGGCKHVTETTVNPTSSLLREFSVPAVEQGTELSGVIRAKAHAWIE